ncbi:MULTISPECIES: GtrA family protein [unclassified Isoptericola]|uniref:GtrA family protein n=1 Tax=unclassified Isoptericola TaxID=2623355 RepID=UPI00364BF749
MTEPVTGPPRRGWILALLRRRESAYLVVGAINTLVGLAAFAVLERTLGDVIGYLGALVLAYAVGIVVGFTLHRRFVFKVRGGVWLDLARFVSVQLGALALNAALLPAFVELAHLPVLPAQVLALALTVVASYFAHLYFSFRRPAGTARPPEQGPGSGHGPAGGDDDR